MVQSVVLTTLLFVVFSGLMLLCGLMVIVARNPVHSALFLIVAFFNAAGLFLLTGAEFLSMLLIVVYVGAVAVLFLFVVMMLDMHRIAKIDQRNMRHLPLGIALVLVLFAELGAVVSTWKVAGGLIPSVGFAGAATNTQALGNILYTSYFLPFQVCGLVLLVAMLGAIVLTLRHREGVQRQAVPQQIARVQSIRLLKPESGKGMDSV